MAVACQRSAQTLLQHIPFRSAGYPPRVTPTTRTILWLDPAQIHFASQIADVTPLEVIAWGCPPGAARSLTEDPAAAFPDADQYDNPRRILRDNEPALFLQLSPSPAADANSDASPADDPEFAAECRERRITLASLEPTPPSVADCAGFSVVGAPEPARFLPLLFDSPILRGAAEAIEHFAPVRTVTISSRAPFYTGSLAARLFDAMHFLHALLALPESIDAAHAAPSAPGAGPPATNRSLRSIRGDLTANLRVGLQRAASITVSDRAGRWFRGVTLLGENGCLRLDEHSFEHLDAEGNLIDSSSVPPEILHPDPAVNAVAHALRRLLDPHRSPLAPIDHHAILAMCQAAVLSASTAQAEAPQTILRIAHARL